MAAQAVVDCAAVDVLHGAVEALSVREPEGSEGSAEGGSTPSGPREGSPERGSQPASRTLSGLDRPGSEAASASPPGRRDASGLIDEAVRDALMHARQRIYVLRFENDVDRFVSGTDKDFLFDLSLTGYQRLLAHRVAQYYGLETCTVEEGAHQGHILARRTPATKPPLVKLADAVIDKVGNGVEPAGSRVMRKKSSGSGGQAGERDKEREAAGGKPQPPSESRSLQERQQEFFRAKARIFATPDAPQSRDGSQDSPQEKGEGSSKRNGTYSGAKGGSRGGGGASAGRKGSPEGSQGRGYAGNGKKAALRSRDEDLRDPDIRREYMQYPQLYGPGFAEHPGGVYMAQRAYSAEQYPALGGMAPSPPQHTPLGSAHALPFSEPGSPASGRGLVGPGHAMLAHPHAHPGMHGVDRSGPYGISPPGYGHPVQIPPGYALVPTMPHQMPPQGMGMYGQHMMPLHQGMGVPPQAYGYMPGPLQERPPPDVGVPMGPPPPPPMAGHLMPHAAPMPIYPGYHSPQGFGMQVHPMMHQHALQQQPPLAPAQLQPYAAQAERRPSANGMRRGAACASQPMSRHAHRATDSNSSLASAGGGYA